MTFRELMVELSKLTDEQLDMDVVVYVTYDDEYHPVTKLSISNSDNCDVLDNNHPYAELENNGTPINASFANGWIG